MSEAAQQITNDNVNEAVQQIAENNAQRNPEDIAAEFFQEQYPKLNGLIYDLGKKDLRRIIDALIAYPLEMETVPKFTDQKAYLAFALSMRLLEAKQIMINFVQLEQYRALAEQTGEVNASPNNNESPVTEQGEKVNG